MKRAAKKLSRHRKKLLLLLIPGFCLLGFLLYRSLLSFGNPPPPNDLQDQWAFEKIQLHEAWKVTRGKGAKIAIIDSGFTLNNSGISDKIVGIDYYRSGEDSANDATGHGTQNSNIITGPNGVCPECQLIVVKLGAIDSNLKIAQTIRWSVDQGANVINLSFVIEQYDDLIQQEIYRAWQKGVVIIAAAGNNNTDSEEYPGAYGPVVAVAATDRDDKKAGFSNYGEWVNIAAPGVDIYTSVQNGRYVRTSGTSIASPIVAGIAGLVWSSPYGTSNEAVVKRLCDTADKIEGTQKYWKCGRINAARAVGATK
jgi:thermitase